jgi:putative N6-adenine-specific DNA methylase
MKQYKFIATATFGLEAVVKRELQGLNMTVLSTDNGRVVFKGTIEDMVKANLWLRTADRVLLQIDSFKATTFDQLYDHVKRIKWQDFVPKNGKVIVTGKSVKSKLFSISDCQKITKKAISDKLMFVHKVHWLEEEGATYTIQVSLLKDIATLTLDTSGAGLHKRGYRVETVEAPMKETLAAALVQLSYWNKDRPLYDIFTGSGTIPIEAAMIARNIAPGLGRTFAFNDWPNLVPPTLYKQLQKEAFQAIDYDLDLTIYASDISAEVIEKAKENAIEAGVDDCITFYVSDFKDVDFNESYGVILSNPPYGERLLTEEEVITLTKDMYKITKPLDTYSLYFLTSFPDFETYFKKETSRKRKLYNGRIEVWYYQYYGPRPPQE